MPPGMPAAAEADAALEAGLRARGGFAKAGAGAVPVVDLAAPGAAEALWAAASTVGFFTVVNHGLPPALLEGMFARSERFFAQPQAVKETSSPFARQFNSGYEFMTQVRPSTGVPDHKESLQLTARTGVMDGRWPAEPADFEPHAREFMEAAMRVGKRILDLLQPRACPALPAGALAAAHTLWGPDGQTTLRLLHYPPMSADALEGLSPNHWRAGPHTDWCNLTLLFQRVGQGGLECAANPRADRDRPTEWIEAPPVEGGITVNIGDMLSRWSDARLLSNLHRVRMPTAAECSPPKSRYSIAFFLQADKSAVIDSGGSQPPITAGDYILGRIRSNFSGDTTPPKKK